MEEWSVEDLVGAREVEEELINSRERRLRAELLEAHIVGVSLHEQRALASAVHGELLTLELPYPPGQRVVVHERGGDGVPNHRHRVVDVPAAVASLEEKDVGDEEAQPILVVDV
jgi:hypothetical protein